jgi:hypothetical protein
MSLEGHFPVISTSNEGIDVKAVDATGICCNPTFKGFVCTNDRDCTSKYKAAAVLSAFQNGGAHYHCGESAAKQCLIQRQQFISGLSNYTAIQGTTVGLGAPLPPTSSTDNESARIHSSALLKTLLADNGAATPGAPEAAHYELARSNQNHFYKNAGLVDYYKDNQSVDLVPAIDSLDYSFDPASTTLDETSSRNFNDALCAVINSYFIDGNQMINSYTSTIRKIIKGTGDHELFCAVAKDTAADYASQVSPMIRLLLSLFNLGVVDLQDKYPFLISCIQEADKVKSVLQDLSKSLKVIAASLSVHVHANRLVDRSDDGKQAKTLLFHLASLVCLTVYKKASKLANCFMYNFIAIRHLRLKQGLGSGMVLFVCFYGFIFIETPFKYTGILSTI